MNITDMIVVSIVGLAAALVLWRMYRNKKAGRSSCGCGSCSGSCAGCPMSSLRGTANKK